MHSVRHDDNEIEILSGCVNVLYATNEWTDNTRFSGPSSQIQLKKFDNFLLNPNYYIPLSFEISSKSTKILCELNFRIYYCKALLYHQIKRGGLDSALILSFSSSSRAKIKGKNVDASQKFFHPNNCRAHAPQMTMEYVEYKCSV